MAVSEDEVERQIRRWLLENGKTNRDTASSLASLEKDSGIRIPRDKNLINFFLKRPELFGMVYRRNKYPHVYAIVSLFSRDAVPRLTQDEREQYFQDVADKQAREEDIDNMLVEASSMRSPPPPPLSLFSGEELPPRLPPRLLGGKSKSKSRSAYKSKSRSARKSRTARKSKSRKNRNRRNKTARY
jgi:hypothetical protein